MLAALHLVALALFIGVALAWGRHRERRRLVASGFIAVMAVTLIYLVMVRPTSIPIDWITTLHHGLERQSIFHLYARGAHVDVNFDSVLSAVAAGPVPNLRDVVWMNLLLALVNAAIFFHIALYVTGPIWAFPWTLVFALNPAMFLASFSELPTHLLAVYFLAAVIAWATLNDPLRQPRVIRAAAFALCVVLTLFAFLTRFEVALIGIIALTLHAGYAVIGAGAWTAAEQRLRHACEWALVFFEQHRAALAVLFVAGCVVSNTGVPKLVGRGTVAGLNPFNPSIFSLLAYLPLLALPIGVSVAIVFGSIPAIVHFRRFGGLALSLFILVRVYFATWYEYFEMGRYLSYILPAIFLLGLFGKAQLDEIARRRWSPNWGRAARIGYLATWFTLPLPGVLEYYLRPDFDIGGGFSQLLLDRNNQREVRHLLTLTENNPQCAFVGRVVQERQGDLKVGTQYAYVVFGAPVASPIVVPEDEGTLDDVITRYASRASCVRLYYGGDCNLTFTDRCEQFIVGRRFIDEERFWSRPYNNPFESGYGAPEIVLATYAWP